MYCEFVFQGNAQSEYYGVIIHYPSIRRLADRASVM